MSASALPTDSPNTADSADHQRQQADLLAILAELRRAHQQQRPSLAQRRADIKALLRATEAHRDDLIAALSADFGNRSRHETLIADVMVSLNEMHYILPRLRRWMQPQHVPVDWKFWPARAEILHQPLGVVGVMGPWNYPVQLVLIPLASALGAGNHVMIKPSENAPHTAEVVNRIIEQSLPATRVRMVQGDEHVARAFSALPFDHLFFTGSTAVGRHVMRAAADNLTPVTLELGGKSPAIIDDDYPLGQAAARLVAGKLLNAGQTCTAPDYLLVAQKRLDALVDALRRRAARAYPQLANNPDLTHIINQRQFERLMGLLEDARAKGARIEHLGPPNAQPDADQRIMPPTLVLGMTDEMQIAQEEIFGPLLPIVGVGSLDQAIEYVNARPRPLALYHFSRNPTRQRKVLANTLSGGVGINDTNYQVAQEGLPFGGVGPSGMGHYHGQHGFLTFSKQRGVFYQARYTALSILRAPYSKLADWLLRWLA